MGLHHQSFRYSFILGVTIFEFLGIINIGFSKRPNPSVAATSEEDPDSRDKMHRFGLGLTCEFQHFLSTEDVSRFQFQVGETNSPLGRCDKSHRFDVARWSKWDFDNSNHG